MPSTPAKTCKRCGKDCTHSPRFRDARGGYICAECESQLRAAATVATHAAATATPPSPAGDDVAIPLADDPAFDTPAQSRTCTNCGAPLGANIVCVTCGLNSTTGAHLDGRAPTKEGETCRKCGYPLTGLKSRQCPECGTYNGRRRRDDKDLYDHIARVEYIKPAVMIAIGMPVAILMQLVFGDSIESIGFYLLAYFISIPIGVTAYFLCCLGWLGFDAPHHLTALRLAGVYAASDAASAIIGQICFVLPIPILFGPWMLGLIVYIGLLSDTLDIEVQDAIMVGLLTFALRLGAFIGLAYLLGAMAF